MILGVGCILFSDEGFGVRVIEAIQERYKFPDNVLVVPAQVFGQWVEGLKTSGSGSWPLAFYQNAERTRVERWVPGTGREDVTAYLNNYASLEAILG